MILTGLNIIADIRMALLGIFNVGIVVRLIMILQSANDEEQDHSPKKRIKNHLIAAIIVNIAGGLVIVISKYYQ